MAAALNSHLDDSISPQTSLSHPDFSLGSFASGLSTPRRSLRAPSATSRSTAPSSAQVLTPSSGTRYGNRPTPGRARASVSDYASLLHDEEDVAGGDQTAGDVLDTPGVEDGGAVSKGRTRSGTLTSSNATTSKGSKLTLRDQEKHIDNLKKENFSIKLRVHFLEDQLARLAPDQMEAALKQNINLKIEVQQRGMEIKKLKKLVLSLEHELERLQRGGNPTSGSTQRERELEERLEERELELRELRRRKAERDDDGDEALREAEDRNRELEDELDNVKGLLEDNMDEIQRLQDLVSKDSSALEDENHRLREKLDSQEELVARLQDDRDDLADTLNELQLRLEDLQQRRHSESLERSASRAALVSEQEEREDLEDEVNRLRDRVAALMIELQAKEDDLDRSKREIDEIVEEHRNIVETVEAEWRGEVDEAHVQNEELKDVLAERDNECRELRISVSEFEANQNDLHAKYEGAIAQLEDELEERQHELERRDAEMEDVRGTIDKLGEQIYMLEDENDRLKEDMTVEKERLEGVITALKDKIADIKAESEDLQDAYAQSKREQESLASHIEILVSELETTRNSHNTLTNDLETLTRTTKRQLESKETALQTALGDAARLTARLAERESDLAKVQGALEEKERESRVLGESATTTKFSLQLEVDRLKRDLERAEDEVNRLRAELAGREAGWREKDAALDKAYQENRELASELASAVQARLNIAEKLDECQKGVKEREGEVATLKTRLGEVEGRLSKDQRALMQAEGMYRDQLTERNTLLLTIYQYLDKILGVDKTPKKGGAETKPFTNFSIFHDNLITRLKALSQIQSSFEQRTKDAEGRFMDKMGEMKRQLEVRWRQIDKFEASVRALGEAKGVWRKKLSVKEGELDAARATNAELTSQLTLFKRPNTSESMEVRSLAARATNAERRLNNTQNQLAAAEEKIAALNQKSGVADDKWEARVREYEARLRAAEERVKRERQGGKERVAELEGAVKNLQRQVEMAQKRSGQIGEVLEMNGRASNSSSSPNPNR